MGQICSKCNARNQGSRRECQFCGWNLSETYSPPKKGLFGITKKGSNEVTAKDVSNAALDIRGKVMQQNKDTYKAVSKGVSETKNTKIKVGTIKIGDVELSAVELEYGKSKQKANRKDFNN